MTVNSICSGARAAGKFICSQAMEMVSSYLQSSAVAIRQRMRLHEDPRFGDFNNDGNWTTFSPQECSRVR